MIMVHVGVCDTVDQGYGQVDVYCHFTAGDPFDGEPRRWRALISFDFQVGAARWETGPDGEQPDAEQLAIMKSALPQLGGIAGQLHGYDNRDQKFSTN